MSCRCRFVLVHKQGRTCSLAAHPPHAFCAEHLYEGTHGQHGLKRILCPLDPTHSVYEIKVNSHLKACAKRLAEKGFKLRPASFSAHLHAGSGTDSDDECDHATAPQGPKRRLGPPVSGIKYSGDHGEHHGRTNRTVAQIMRRGGVPYVRHLMKRIRAVYATTCGAGVVVEDLALMDPQDLPRIDPRLRHQPKHARQAVSITRHLEQCGCMMAKDTSVVEFGAGRGYLAAHLIHHLLDPRKETIGLSKDVNVGGVRTQSQTRCVLVDAGTFRRKADRYLREVLAPGCFERVGNMNLVDFDVSRVATLRGVSNYVGVGKHLCGACTDFMLRACIPRGDQGKGEETTGSISTGPKGDQEAVFPPPRATSLFCDAFAVAPCCHHRCSWRHFLGRPQARAAGFDRHDFGTMAWLSGFALCGHDTPTPNEKHDDKDDYEDRSRNQRTTTGNNKDDHEDQARTQAATTGTTTTATTTTFVINNNTSTSVPNMVITSSPPKATGLKTKRSHDADAEAYEEPAGPLPPSHSLRRSFSTPQLQEIGAMCKELIDAWRLAWLVERGCHARLVGYCSKNLSGENRLLVGTPPPVGPPI